jgi:hypothetical protein
MNSQEDENNGCPQSWRELNNIFKQWKPTLEVIGIVLAIIVAVLIYLQYREMQLTRIMDERAWVAISDVKCSQMNTIEEFDLTYKNTGKTPAINTQIQVISTGFLKDIPKKDAMPNPQLSSALVAPDGTGFTDIKQPVLAVEAVGTFYLYGTIWYDDIFGKHHWSQFCFYVRCDTNTIVMGPAAFHFTCDDTENGQNN